MHSAEMNGTGVGIRIGIKTAQSLFSETHESPMFISPGGVAELSNAAVLKTAVGASSP